MKKIRVGLEVSTLSSGHATRGIGTYTRQLQAELQKLPGIELLLINSQDKKIPSNIDILHIPYFDFFRTSLPFFSHQKRVITIHDVIPLLFPNHYPAGIKGSIALAKQKFSLKTVAAVITDSNASKLDIIKHLSVPEHKINTIYLAGGPEISRTSNAEIQAARASYLLPAQYILYVGDINYNKNIPQLIKSLKFLPDSLSLVCVGKNFYPHQIPEWQAIDTQVEMSLVRDRVHFISNLDTTQQNELAAIYSGAVAYVQPSLYEGFGLPVLEAMQCGTPTVVAKNSSLVEVGGNVSYYVDPTAESIAAGVAAVLKMSPSKLSTWRKSASAWTSRFSWSKTALQTYEVYQTVMGQK